MDFNAIFDLIKKINNKKVKLILISVILWIVIWFFLPELSYNWKINKISLNLFIRLFISIVILVILICKLFIVKRNKSKLPGIGFYINSSILSVNDVRKTLFFDSLKKKLNGKYEIILYDHEDLALMIKNNSYEEVAKKLNLSILIFANDRVGTKCNADIYEVNVENVTIRFPFAVDTRIFGQFSNDFIKSSNFCFGISKNNSLSEVDSEVSLFQLHFNYIMAIISIISPEPESALPILKDLFSLIRTSGSNSKQMLYVKDNIYLRYIEAYYNSILKILNVDPYYADNDILKHLVHLHTEYSRYLKSCWDRRLIDRRNYSVLMNDLYMQEAIILYEQDDIKGALKSIYKCDLTLSPNTPALFSKAFLLACDMNFDKSFDIYSKLRKKDIDSEQFNSITLFIEKRFDLNKNNLAVKFCLAVINYYFKDKGLAKRLFKDIIGENIQIKKIYDSLDWS